MKGLFVIISKEWRFLTGSDKGIFFLFLFLVFSWSVMLVAPQDTALQNSPLLLVFFSVIISANFSNTVFISERTNGILEILITSGLTRKQILFGKMLFVGGMSCVIGLLCSICAMLLNHFIFHNLSFTITPADLTVYFCATYFNTASSAYLSVRMSNPRLLHIANLFFLAIIITAYTVVSNYYSMSFFILPVILLIAALIFTAASVKIYESEKILQPVTM